jgi:hypothetical protein
MNRNEHEWRKRMTGFFVGVDLGQARDFTALAVLELTEVQGAWDAENWTHQKVIVQRVRHLERVPLGTPYPEVVERVSGVMKELGRAGRCELIVDATGVGRPVVDMLRREGLDCMIRAVMVTGGGAEAERDGFYRVPKRDLITGLQLLLQTGALKIAKGLEWGAALLKEMSEMRVKVTVEGNETFGSWREGTHDDLVFAVALAGWGAERWQPGDMCGRHRLI